MDFITSAMVFMVSFISLLVIIFSFEYMENDPFFPRFISLLSVFTFFMVFFVCSDNFIQFFLGWEGIGLCSYLLINFWFSRIQAVKSAFKALLVNRVGDVCLLISFCLIFFLYGTLDFSILNLLIPFFKHEFFLIGSIKFNLLFLIGFFLFIGVLSKSAQIGLHTWLPDAMEGPTPVSALIHAATMVTAGVYLLIRLSFIFEFIPNLLTIIALIGGITAFFSASVALVQLDIKKLIAYSTCSQLGYMVFACGISFYNLSLFHLFNHAFFKALLFLTAGSIIHSLDNEQDLRKMGGLLKILPNSYISILIASLSLGGFPFLSGFYSKDIIIELSSLNFSFTSIFCFWLIYCAAFLTMLYSIKLVFLIFYGKFNYYKSKSNFIYESGYCIFLVQVLLIVFSIFSGYIFKEYMIGFGSFFSSSSILELPKSIFFFDIECFYEIFYFYNFGFNYLVLIKFLPFYSVLISLSIYFKYFTSFYKHFIFSYHYKKKTEINLWRLTELYSKLIFFLSNKWYIDYIYNNHIVKPLLTFSLNIFFNYFDKGLIELLGPSSTLYVLKISKFFNKVQYNFLSNIISLTFIFFIFSLFMIFIIYILKIVFIF